MELIQPGPASLGTEAAQTRRLLLVDPYPRNNPYHLTASERRAVWFSKLSLPVVQDIEFDHPCDLIGLSIITCSATQAYEVAAEFRKQGKTVVLGGVHPAYCAEEALHHSDSIVCGEAEDLWPTLIADFEAGTMKRIYKMESTTASNVLASKQSHVYCDPSCKGYAAMVERKNVVTFTTAEEAEEAGYHKAVDCPQDSVKQ